MCLPLISVPLLYIAPSGSCDTTCSSSTLPGSTVMYITHDRNGYQQVSVGVAVGVAVGADVGVGVGVTVGMTVGVAVYIY